MNNLKDNIFKEYDIRGIVDTELTPYIVKLIGYFLGKRVLLNAKNKDVCIAYDIRKHSPTISEYIISGLNASGANVHNMGMSATGVNYFSNYINNDFYGATIMITASHNPKQYNGFKMTLNGEPFYGKEIQELKYDIQQAMASKLEIKDNNNCKNIDINKLYIKYMVDKFSHLKNIKQKVLLDSGNGSAGFLVDEIFTKLGITFEHLFKEPDGNFPNHHPDPSDEKNLKDIGKNINRFDIAFAFDGDGDRLAVLTNKHNIKGDMLAIIFAKQMDNPIVVAEVKSSKVMYDEINKIGTAIMCKTGHSNIKKKIKEVNASFGAEVSGHMFFNDIYFGFDDGIYGALRVLDLLSKNINLDDEMSKIPTIFSTDELAINVKEENKFKIIDNIAQDIKDNITSLPKIINIIDIDGLRIEFENGWALVRASNTTPILVTRYEANTKEELSFYKKSMKILIDKYKNL